MTPALRFGARSDVGLLRHNNQDSMYAGPRLLAIADGMGGHAAGEVASRIAIETVSPLDLDPPGADLTSGLREAVDTASSYLRDMVAADNALEGMGTTLTALLFAGRRLGLLHIGDSRAYLFRDGELAQITHDHTLVQSLIDEGRLTVEEASSHPQRSWITRALDGRDDLDPDLSVREAKVGDRYLVCSDGLSGVVSEDTIAETLRIADPQEACDRLVDLALRAGGPDNVSCIVADVVDDSAGEDEPIVGGAVTDVPQPSASSDTPARRAAELNAADEAGDGGEPGEQDDARSGGPARRRRRFPGRLVAATAVALLLVAGALVGSWLYIRTQYYVSAGASSTATVGVYRGVTGSVLGLKLSSLDAPSDLPVTALPDYEQPKVRDGIDAKNRSDAQRIVTELRGLACPSPAPTPTPSPAATKKKPAAPAPTPSPPAAYCAGAP